MVNTGLMLKKGFTLVELLIVIGLLGAIALIVIAAINPIEQANRARDTRFKADGGQLISAIDRYFAAKSEFPWVTAGTPDDNEDAFGFVTASNLGVGICGDANCSTQGYLLTSDELKGEFIDRDFIENGGGSDELKKILIGKPLGGSSSVYACFIPASNSTKQKACADGNVYTISATTGARSAVLTATCTDAEDSYVTNSWYVCIPE
jgi:prepilin-type N-terminal cleavage/methylation domain-containing protein